MTVSFVFAASTNAQINVNINLAKQPAWGPQGYDHVDYYYLPDVDAYYSVPQKQFIYSDNNHWVFANTLPPRFGSYNLFSGYKVVINEPRPYLRHDVYRIKYANYKGWKGPRQLIIRESHDNRYKNNGPNMNEHQDRGNGKNRGRGKGYEHGVGNGNGHGNGHGKG